MDGFQKQSVIRLYGTTFTWVAVKEFNINYLIGMYRKQDAI